MPGSLEEQARAHRWHADPDRSARIAEYIISAAPVAEALRGTVGDVVSIDNARRFKLDGARVDSEGWLVVWGEFWNGDEMRLAGKHQQPVMFRGLPDWRLFGAPLDAGKRLIADAIG